MNKPRTVRVSRLEVQATRCILLVLYLEPISCNLPVQVKCPQAVKCNICKSSCPLQLLSDLQGVQQIRLYSLGNLHADEPVTGAPGAIPIAH